MLQVLLTDRSEKCFSIKTYFSMTGFLGVDHVLLEFCLGTPLFFIFVCQENKDLR
jgi:hypothetical protein